METTGSIGVIKGLYRDYRVYIRVYNGIMEKKMETTIVYLGYIRIMEKKMATTIVYWGYIRIMEKKMATTIVYLGYIRIMEKKMATTIIGYIQYIPYNPYSFPFLLHDNPNRTPNITPMVGTSKYAVGNVCAV